MTAKKTSFCQTLGNLQHGDTIDQLDDLLTEALQASNDTGKVSKVTVEFKKIENSSGQKFLQQDFALFLEDIMPYIAEPVATELYEIVQTLSANTKIDFKSGVRTNNGEVTLTYNETIEATAGREGKLTIPENIKFGIQIHRGGEHYALPARFRYRITNGTITFWYDLDQLEKAIEKSMADTIEYLRNGKQEVQVVDDQEVITELPGVNPAVTILEGTAS
ncbi:YfdQ family protein [Acinetobacter baumannii]|uniref:YfdQ family protein n=1 Tax=Acinetobacter baumannii TaxID=470 RepID=UPI0021C62278